MDLKTLGKDLTALQSRLEKIEDLVQAGTNGPESIQEHNLETLSYYRTETAKVRTKYLELLGAVKAELTGE